MSLTKFKILSVAVLSLAVFVLLDANERLEQHMQNLKGVRYLSCVLMLIVSVPVLSCLLTSNYQAGD